MQRALIVGQAIATAKHASMVGLRLMVAQILDDQGRPDGDPQLIADTLGAGVGTIALITSDGKAARQLVGSETTPVRYTTIALEDVWQKGSKP